MRELWQSMVSGILLLTLLGLGAPGTNRAIAQPEAAMLAASGVYEENFSSYAAKDYTDGTAWDVWGDSLRLARTDVVFRNSADAAVDANGYMVVVWSDYRDNGNSDIYMQRLDPNGNRLWVEDRQINTDDMTANHYYPVVSVDNNGNAFVAWARYGNDQKWDIYAQRVNANGVRLWASDMRVNSIQGMSTPYSPPVMALDSSNNAFVAWKGSSIYMQRIDVNGNRIWNEDLLVGDGDYPAIGLDDSETAMIVWRAVGGWFTDINAQRVSAEGVRLWSQPLQINVTPATVQLYHGPGIAVDGNGNATVVWTDSRRGFNKFDIYAQRVDANGEHLWTEDILVDAGQSNPPGIALGMNGNAFIAWANSVQCLDANGNRLWATNLWLSEGNVFDMVREASGNILLMLDCETGICMQRINVVPCPC